MWKNEVLFIGKILAKGIMMNWW